MSFALIFKNQHIFDCSIKQYFKIKNSIIKLFDINYTRFSFDINLFGFLSIGIVTIPEVAREAFNLVKSLYAPWMVEYKIIDEALVLMESYRYIIQRDQTWYKEILKTLRQQ